MTLQEKLKFWFDHNLHNYIEKNGNYDGIEIDVDHIMDWLGSDDAIRHRRQIHKVSVPDAIMLSEKWTKKLNKKSTDKETSEDIDVVLSFKNGFSVVKLKSEQAYRREGLLMQHCVASYFTMRPESTIFSIRDEKNKPLCTIEEDSTGIIPQIKGSENENPNPSFYPFLFEFLSLFTKNRENTMDINQLGFVFDITGHLHDVRVLFSQIECTDDLYLSNLNLKTIPPIKTTGVIYLRNNKIKAFPMEFKQLCELDLSDNLIEKLPNDLVLVNDLDLSNNRIKELPINLDQAGFSLDLSFNQISNIPEYFNQTGSLSLKKNEIESLPKQYNQNKFNLYLT